MNKILIIVDDIFLGDALIQKLKTSGFETLFVRDGASGLSKIREWKPNLVLVDALLPQMNGYEVLEAKQKESSISAIPVIIILNSGQPAEIDRALSFGVKDYVVKSEFNPADVVTKIQLQLQEVTSSTASTAETTRASVKAPSVELHGKKIMWVEDDKFLSDIIARKLGTLGCKLLHATDGEEALKTAEKELPDVILLDILLSGIDGFEILKRLKENPKTRAIPVIMLSNLGQKEDVEKGKKLGAVRFLVKAMVTLDEIVAEIKVVLAIRS